MPHSDAGPDDSLLAITRRIADELEKSHLPYSLHILGAGFQRNGDHLNNLPMVGLRGVRSLHSPRKRAKADRRANSLLWLVRAGNSVKTQPDAGSGW